MACSFVAATSASSACAVRAMLFSMAMVGISLSGFAASIFKLFLSVDETKC
jgi:hypothetical protein